jgi:transposase
MPEALARLRRRLASEVLRDIRTLDPKIVDLNGRIETEVEASGTTLTEIFGVGPILATRIIGTVADVGRFSTKARFAAYSGTAPLEASSGEVVRHRLSLALETASSTTPCTWSLPAKPGRTLKAAPTTARRSRRASPARRRCAVPQEAHLRRRLQEPPGRLADTFAQRRLTKRSLEFTFHALG